jgi:two-component system, chemotaxis family, sensor kinase CheA
MPSKDEELLQRLLAIFKIEAQEHVDAIASGLLELEKASDDQVRAGLLDQTFRSAHSLKGAARAVNVTDVEALCQAVESVFAALKSSKITSTPELFDLLHQVVDGLGMLLDFSSSSNKKPETEKLIRSLEASLTATAATKNKPAIAPADPPKQIAPTPVEEKEKRLSLETVRVSTLKLDSVLRQAEEMLILKQATLQQTARLSQISRTPSEWKKRWARLRPDLRRIERSLKGGETENGSHAADPQLARMVEFLDWSRDFVDSLESELTNLSQLTTRDQRSTAAMIDSLLDEMKKIVMQPFSTLLDVIPRLAREVSRNEGKEVELAVSGGDVEIDRRILEQMKDPVIHLVRNCIDHGIEMPTERQRRGKPAQGKITIEISARNGANVELLISDDGGGIDVEKVKDAARKQRVLSPEKIEALDTRETLQLIFQSGLSTSPIVTDISGRGLGLAIVKEKVEKLNGTLTVDSERGQGTSFRMTLPLTLARFHGVLVRASEQIFVLPTSYVERVIRLAQDKIKTIENREAITLDGQVVALARLHEILDLNAPEAGRATDNLHVVVLNSDHQRIAFVVEDVLQEQEVLVKTLGKHLEHVRNIAGATVLGTGRVAPILNVPELIQSVILGSKSSSYKPRVVAEEMAGRKKSILVAEDSITSRTLLKNILETAGYEVETSVDGVDALTKLRSGQFDLVVSDVDMPRMNGFGLTSKIRADKRFIELPVILVTSLDSREDREHGIDVGATAYIVKSSFDQSNLLEMIRRSL